MGEKSANLDLLRSLAVSLVVLTHVLLVLNGGDTDAFNLHAMGRAGVAIFFVHTTLVLLQSLDRNGSAAVPFFIRRMFRLYPLSITVVTFLALLKWAAGLHDPAQVWSNLLLVMNITGHGAIPAQLWSLPYEVQMYLALPLLYIMATKKRSLVWAGVLFATSVLLAIALPSTSLGYRLLRFVPCFIPGVLAFVLTRRVKPFLAPWVLFAVAIGGAAVCLPVLVAAGVPELHLLWGISFVLGVTIPMCRPMPDGRIARAAALVALYSYGIYLTHDFAIWPLNGVAPGMPWFAQWGAFLILLIGLPYMVHHGVEKHGIRLGAALAQRVARTKKPCSPLSGTTRAKRA